MKLVLDTHVFLWYIAADPLIPVAYRDAIRDPANEVYLSAASVWEAVIKHALGKLPLPESPAVLLPRERVAHGILTLPVNETEMQQLARLPALHRDPFDRILVAQALHYGLTILTVDNALKAYPAPILPAI